MKKYIANILSVMIYCALINQVSCTQVLETRLSPHHMLTVFYECDNFFTARNLATIIGNKLIDRDKGIDRQQKKGNKTY